MKDHSVWRRGFTLIEMMVVVSVFTVMMMGVSAVFIVGNYSWFNADAQITVRQSVRTALMRITQELRESGFDHAGAVQVAIVEGAGFNGTDIVRFSIPIVCETGGVIIGGDGGAVRWGAPLTWGCRDASCMDADNDCETIDYTSIEYAVNGSRALVRRVRDAHGTVAREDIFAGDISDFRVDRNGDVVTVTVAAERLSALNHIATVSEHVHVFLRNRG